MRNVKWLYLLDGTVYCHNSCTIIRPLQYNFMPDFNSGPSVLRTWNTQTGHFSLRNRGTATTGSQLCGCGSSSVVAYDRQTPTGCFSVVLNRRLAMTAWSLKILSGGRNPPKKEGLWMKWHLWWNLALKGSAWACRRCKDCRNFALRTGDTQQSTTYFFLMFYSSSHITMSSFTSIK